MITAHGGAMDTGRNTLKYFNSIHNYNTEAIEVDIHKRGKVLYLAHILPKLFLSKAIKLDFVFDFCKKFNKIVNCDLKKSGMLKYVVELAKKMNAEKHIYFTGSVKPEEIQYLDAGDIYLNDEFYSKKIGTPTLENIEKIQAYLASFNNAHIKGLNLNYKKITMEFLKKAKEIGLGISLYTVDTENELRKFLPLHLDNITTNNPVLALKIQAELEE